MRKLLKAALLLGVIFFVGCEESEQTTKETGVIVHENSSDLAKTLADKSWCAMFKGKVISKFSLRSDGTAFSEQVSGDEQPQNDIRGTWGANQSTLTTVFNGEKDVFKIKTISEKKFSATLVADDENLTLPFEECTQ